MNCGMTVLILNKRILITVLVEDLIPWADRKLFQKSSDFMLPLLWGKSHLLFWHKRTPVEASQCCI